MPHLRFYCLTELASWTRNLESSTFLLDKRWRIQSRSRIYRGCDKIAVSPREEKLSLAFRERNTRNAASVGGMLDLITEGSANYFNYPLVNLQITGGYGCSRFIFVATERIGREFRDVARRFDWNLEINLLRGIKELTWRYSNGELTWCNNQAGEGDSNSLWKEREICGQCSVVWWIEKIEWSCDLSYKHCDEYLNLNIVYISVYFCMNLNFLWMHKYWKSIYQCVIRYLKKKKKMIAILF